MFPTTHMIFASRKMHYVWSFYILLSLSMTNSSSDKWWYAAIDYNSKQYGFRKIDNHFSLTQHKSILLPTLINKHDAEEILTKFLDKMKKDYGKVLPSPDIDNVLAAEYFIKYFDQNSDQKVSLKEYETKMESDQDTMKKSGDNEKMRIKKSRKRDPGLAWILDFDNDGWTTDEEVDAAPELLTMDPTKVDIFLEQQRQNNSKRVKTEL